MSILTLSLSAVLLGASTHAAPEAALLARTVPLQDAQTRVQALIEEYQQVQSKFYARLQKIEDKAAMAKVLEQENPLPAFIERFRELAYDSAGSEAGVTAWVWVGNLSMDYDRSDEAREALEILVTDHLDSPQLGTLATNVRYGAGVLGQEAARGTLRAILSGSPHMAVKAQAQFSLASLLMESGSEGDTTEGRALFEGMLTEFADVEGGWAQRAKGMLFELEHLQIGMLAPDFEAVDQDGVAWKLSDYRGKVVVVDFWGFW